MKKLKVHIGGKWIESESSSYMNCYNPSVGEIIALAPECTRKEIDMAISSAKKAFPGWANTPPIRRAQILFKVRELIHENLNELTTLLSTEHGKCQEESMGDILKGVEVIEFACGIQQLLKSDVISNVTQGYDTIQIKEPVGVFLGICPWNFPAMIPHGWMIPLCVATGNTIIIKAAKEAPQSAFKIMELWQKAGIPDGVINIVTCGRDQTEYMIKHPDIQGISFVGSTGVGSYIYATAAAARKRVQTLCEAKNHALVMDDCALEATVNGIVNAAYGCAGQRCMALPVAVVHENIADKFVKLLKQKSMELKIGPGYEKTSQLGPVVNQKQYESVTNWIQKGVEEGVKLILDGRNVKVPGYEKGFYIGPTIFDHVKPGMSVGDCEIFGPVICIKRVKSFEEGLELMNSNQFANGSVIYTQSGYYAREFSKRTHGGMVGINVGIPVPASVFGFTGHKNSFFGDLHIMGMDGVRFYTQLKSITTQWFSETSAKKKVDSWDGMLDIQEKK